VNNIRTRRGEKVCMHLPVFRDARTGDAKLTKDVTDAQRAVGGEVIELLDLHGTKVEEEVYMDSMAFGMGMCCLQITFQALDINEARDLYDQLAVVAPLFMAISAGTPMIKGWLLDTDTRWDVISGSVDCRSHSPRLQTLATLD
jgi:glutamate--cysteine ligase catalytic subunit